MSKPELLHCTLQGTPPYLSLRVRIRNMGAYASTHPAADEVTTLEVPITFRYTPVAHVVSRRTPRTGKRS